MRIELSEDWDVDTIFEILSNTEKKELLDLLLEDKEKKYAKKISEMLNPELLTIRDMLANKKSDREIVEKIKDIFKEFDVL